MPMEFYLGTRIAEAVSDPERTTILRALSGAELSAEALIAAFPGSQDRLLRHLEILRGAALIASRSDGLSIYYRIDPNSGGILKNLTA